MELDHEIRSFIAETDRIFGADYGGLPISAQRRVYDDWCRVFAGPPVQDVVAEIVVMDAGSAPRVRALLQRPKSIAPDAALPVLLYFHGGGWVMGSPESHAGITAAIAAHAGVAVLSVDYRLAPEQPFPAAFDDAYAALAWVAREGRKYALDTAHLAVAGDSAGGNLAAAVALAARDRGGPHVALQGLFYPFLKARRRAALDDPNAGTEAGMAGYLKAYGGGLDLADNPYALPLAEKNFAGLPPAFIADAEIDILREDGADYAAALERAGVAVEHRRGRGLTHSYLRCIHFSRAAYQEFDAFCAALRKAFGMRREGAAA